MRQATGSCQRRVCIAPVAGVSIVERARKARCGGCINVRSPMTSSSPSMLFSFRRTSHALQASFSILGDIERWRGFFIGFQASA